MSRAPHRWSWIALAAALSLGTAVSNGLGRFCYALILPAMQADLEWSYTQAGWMNGAHSLGYLAGALVASLAVRARGARAIFTVCMLATGVLLAATGFTASFPALFGLRVVTGLAGALTFVAGGVLAATIAGDARRSAAAISIYFSGIGLAMLAAGLVIPPALARGGDATWWVAWLGLGAAALTAWIPAQAAARQIAADAPREPIARARVGWRRFWPVLVTYFAFGLGFIGYMTFIVAYLRAGGTSAGATTLVWALLATSALATPLYWQYPMARWGSAPVIALSTIITGCGVAIALAGTSVAWLALSGIVFGAGFLIGPAAVTALAKERLPADAWPSAVAGFTVVFAVGQVAGPVLVGWLSDLSGGLTAGLAGSALVLIVGGAIGFAQRPSRN